MLYIHSYSNMIRKEFVTSISIWSNSWCVWMSRSAPSSNVYAQILQILLYSQREPRWVRFKWPSVTCQLEKFHQRNSHFLWPCSSPKSPTLVSIITKHNFSRDGNKIRLPITEVIVFTTVSDLAQPKKLHYWVLIKSSLLPPLLDKSVILKIQSYVVDILKTVVTNISKHGSEVSANTSDIHNKVTY